MPDISQFTDLGVSGIMLAILFFIVRSFVNSIEQKDKYIRETTREFTKIVGNHIDHSTTAIRDNTKALNRLSDRIEKD